MTAFSVRLPMWPTPFLLPLLLSACCLLILPDPVRGQSPPSRQPRTWPTRVLPGMASFPSNQEILNLEDSLNGSMVYPTHEHYTSAATVYNMRVIVFPEIIFFVQTVEDVQKVVVWAKQHNLFLSVRSSGHSYIGRSTHAGSVVINLHKMKGRQFKLDSERVPAGEITVESGNSWLEVYQEVDKQVTYDGPGGSARRRVIVGGSAHTVAMGGYTLGGGHSPICRQLGMAVDNLLEAILVLADGRKAVVNAEGTTLTDLEGNSQHLNDTSLFWALRGGGGGTWGVVTHFTFRLHFAPQRFRRLTLNWALLWKGLPIGRDTLKFVLRQLGQLSNDWGGYMIVNGIPLDEDSSGQLTLFLNHFGNDTSPSNSEVDDLINYYTESQWGKNDTTFSTFLDYESTVWDPPSTYAYIYNNFIHNHTLFNDTHVDRLVNFLMDLIDAPSKTSLQTCTGALIGGRMNEVATGQTPVNPKFRSGLLSMSCDIGWSDAVHQDDFYINKTLMRRDELSQLGEGTYFNEPAEDLDDWKQQFWGSLDNYDRLLQVKRHWDPHNYFWCHNCVGSDLAEYDTTTPAPTTTLGQCPSSSGVRVQGGPVGCLLLAVHLCLFAFKRV